MGVQPGVCHLFRRRLQVQRLGQRTGPRRRRQGCGVTREQGAGGSLRRRVPGAGEGGHRAVHGARQRQRCPRVRVRSTAPERRGDSS